MRILVIDDEPAQREILADEVAKAGYSVDQAASAAEAAARLARDDIDVALCDIKMPDGNGVDLVRNTRAAGIETIFIMVTAFATVETAVEALLAGASDYLTKPLRYAQVLHRLSEIDALRGLREENKVLRKAVNDSAPKLYRFTSPGMLEIERLVSKVAPSDNTVLITGESGTGKGMVARWVHEQSERRDKPYLPVNCGAIPEHLMESEFFGHTKGAFTSADHARKGLFLQADQGTLFLDEISELPLHMQTKLLNVVEDKAVRPVGSEQFRRVDARIIAATNADLLERVRQGRFREDLYFRLSAFHIQIPPLRERQTDISGLIRFLLRSTGTRAKNSRPMEIDPMAEEILLGYDWPGNVREVENVITRACLLAEDDCIGITDLPVAITQVASPRIDAVKSADYESLRGQLRRMEVHILLRAIRDANGDRKLAAQRLDISLSSLYRKLEEFDPQGPPEETV